MDSARLSRELLESILHNAADGITVQDPRGRLIYANATAARTAGFATPDELLATSEVELSERFEVFNETGERLMPDRWPGAIALQGRASEPTILRYRARATGEDRWAMVRATPVFDASGQLEYEVTTSQDITEVMRGESRLRLLADASDLLSSSIDFDATLASVVRLAVTQLTDWAAIDLIEGDGSTRRLAVACADRVTEERARELQDRYPPRSDSGLGSAKVIGSGRPLLITDVTEGMLVEAAVDEENLRLLREIGLRSVMVAPLRARGRVLGAISFISVESERRYTRADLTLAVELANCAALAVDNARLYREAREAVIARDRLLATISHDLRTPLTTIRGMTQVLLTRVDPSASISAPQVIERLSLLARAAEQMNSLMDDVLDLARIESGRSLELHLETIDPCELVSATIDRIASEDESHRFVLQKTDGRVRAEWDARRIQRVLRNLMRNAIQFSPEGSTIDVAVHSVKDASRDEDMVEISVRDEGVGIPSVRQPFVFAPRVDRQHPAQPGYTLPDIGLAGSRQIAEQHGGTLTFSSEEGRGSTFVLCLPLARMEAGVSAC
jgi:PAS domain S-box-containing protein